MAIGNTKIKRCELVFDAPPRGKPIVGRIVISFGFLNSDGFSFTMEADEAERLMENYNRMHKKK